MQARGAVLNESMPNIASLNQTRARYQRIINDLTGGGGANASRQPTSPEAESFSDGQPRSSSLTPQEHPIGMHPEEPDSLDATPQEIKDYVRQFKLEVEEKFIQSDTNRAYQFPFKKQPKEPETGGQEASCLDSSMKSLVDISRYDLRSQNIFNMFVQARMKSNNKKTVDFDASVVVDMLKEIAKIDKDSLKCQLQSSQSNILKALLATLEDKFLAEIDNRRVKEPFSNRNPGVMAAGGLDRRNPESLGGNAPHPPQTGQHHPRFSDTRLQTEMETYSKESREQSDGEEEGINLPSHPVGRKNHQPSSRQRSSARGEDHTSRGTLQGGSQENIHIQNVNGDPKLKHLKNGTKLKNRKSQEIGSSNDNIKHVVQSSKRGQKVDKDRGSTDRHGQTMVQDFFREPGVKELLPRSKSNNNQAILSRESLEFVEVHKPSKKLGHGMHLKSSIGGSTGIPVSPRGVGSSLKATGMNQLRKNRPSVAGKTQKHAVHQVSSPAHSIQQSGMFAGSKVGAGVLSPTKINTITCSGGMSYGLAKFSNHTILTANTLTSTLSPKSNVSSNTAKSASKKRLKKGLIPGIGVSTYSHEKDGQMGQIHQTSHQQLLGAPVNQGFSASQLLNGTQLLGMQGRGHSNQSTHSGNQSSSRRVAIPVQSANGLSGHNGVSGVGGQVRSPHSSTQHLGVSSAQLASKIRRALAEESPGVMKPSLMAAATSSSSYSHFGPKGVHSIGSRQSQDQHIAKKMREASSSLGRGQSHSRTGVLSPTYSASNRGPPSSRAAQLLSSGRPQLRDSSSGAKQDSSRKRKVRPAGELQPSGVSSGGTSTLQHILLGNTGDLSQVQPLSRVNWKRRLDQMG